MGNVVSRRAVTGADVGELESMVARNYTAVTTLRFADTGELVTADVRRAARIVETGLRSLPAAD